MRSARRQCASAADAATAARAAAPSIRDIVTARTPITASMFIYDPGYSSQSSTSGYYFGIHYEVASTGTCSHTIVFTVPLRQLTLGGPTASEMHAASTALTGLLIPGLGTMRVTAAVGCDVGTLNNETQICECDRYHDLESAFTTPGHTCAQEVAINGYQVSALLGGRINREVCDICARTCCIALWPYDAPTVAPSISPSAFPSYAPSISPSASPSSNSPSASPTPSPTSLPTPSPTTSPTLTPTVLPTTSEPSVAPTQSPTRSPTVTTCPRDLDLVFVLDDSRSVSLDGTDNMKAFINTFLDYYAWDAVPSMSPPKHGTRIGMVTFSGDGEYVGSAKTHFQLGQTHNSSGAPWTRQYTQDYLRSVSQVAGNTRAGTTHTDKGIEQAICLLDHTFVSRTTDFSCQIRDKCGYKSAYDRGICNSTRLLVRVNSNSGTGSQAYPRDLPLETPDVLTRLHGPRQLNKQIHKVVIVLTDGLPTGDHVTPTEQAVNMLRDEVNADVHLVTVGSSAANDHIIRDELRRIFGIGEDRPVHSSRAHHFGSYQQLSDVARIREVAEAVCPYCAADMHSDCASRVRVARLGCEDPEALGCDSTCCQTQSPTVSPTVSPTASTPTDSPSASPTTSGPTKVPTSMPTSSEPTIAPSTSPTRSPTVMHCPNELDVTFLIDASTSFTEFEASKSLIKQTMTDSNYFFNSQPNTHPNVGISSFSHPNEARYYPRVEFAQDSVGSHGTPEEKKQHFNQMVDGIHTTGGLSFIWPALDMIRPTAPDNPMGWRPVEEGRRRVVVIVTDGKFTDFRHPFAEPEFYDRAGYTGYPGYAKQRGDTWAETMRWPPCDGCFRSNDTSSTCSSATDSCTPLCDYKKSLAAEGVEVIGIPTDPDVLDSLSLTSPSSSDVSSTWQMWQMLADRIPVEGEPTTTPGGLLRLRQAICYPRPQNDPSRSTCETRMPTTSPSPSPTTVRPTTSAPSPSPTTNAPTTSEPTAAPTSVPTTSDPTTVAPVTAAPVTSAPTTAAPTTVAPVTVAPVTVAPVTSAPTTSVPSLAPTLAPTTSEPTACSGFQDTVMTRATCLIMRAAGECGEQMIGNLCGFTCAGCDYPSPTPSPTTALPTTSAPTTTSPTPTPTASPTPAPTPVPTSSAPTPGPTLSPSPNPTLAPTSVCAAGTLEDRVIAAPECQSLMQVGACTTDAINRYCAYSCAGCAYPVPELSPTVTTSPEVAETEPSTESPTVTTLPDVTETGPVPEGNSVKNCSTLQAETIGLRAAEGGWVFRDPDQSVCAASNISGLCWGTDRQHRVSFEDATEICRTAGARLCSTGELASNFARGTGCSLDQKPVWAVDGTPRFGSGTRTIPASVTRTKFAVRCCADAVGRNPARAVESAVRSVDPCVHLVRTHGFILRDSSRSVCATSFEGDWNGGCPPTQSFAAAQGMCQSAGARLCTTAELTGDLTRGTGCGIDASKKVWTSDSCNGTSGPSFRTAGGSSFSSAGSECARSPEVARAVRCCGDAVSSAAAASSDAVTDGDGSSSSSPDHSTAVAGAGAATVALVVGMGVAVLGAIAAAWRHRNLTAATNGKAADVEGSLTLPAAVQMEPVDGPPSVRAIAWE